MHMNVVNTWMITQLCPAYDVTSLLQLIYVTAVSQDVLNISIRTMNVKITLENLFPYLSETYELMIIPIQNTLCYKHLCILYTLQNIRYNVMQYIMMLHPEKQWQQQNIYHISNSRKTHDSSPLRASYWCLLWGFCR